MNVIKFKLPANFEPKCKAYRSRSRTPRSAHTTPDTLFSLCELTLRKLLGGRIPRRRFWPTVLFLLPGPQSRRVGVRHQLEHPQDFNVHLRGIVNDANHWNLLGEALRHEPHWPRIRIGDPARDRITRLHQDNPQPQHLWQIRPFDMLTSAFIVRTAAKIASLEQQRSGSRFRSGRTTASLTTPTTDSLSISTSSGRRLSRERSVDLPDERDELLQVQQLQWQQLMVIGKRTSGGSCAMRFRSVPVKASARGLRKPPTR